MLDRNQEISAENLKAIKQFQKNGGFFTIATGRMTDAATPYIHQLKIDLPVILYNGAVLYDPVSKKNIKERHLPNPKKVYSTLKQSINEEVGLLFYQDDKVYAYQRNNLVREYESKEKVFCNVLSEENLDKPIIKILIISNNSYHSRQFEKSLKKSTCSYDLVYSESNYLEILPPKTSKGESLIELKDILKLNEVNTICIGDNLNDLSMLKVADKGFFVENSHRDLKQNLFYSCSHHTKNALANVIYNHICIPSM